MKILELDAKTWKTYSDYTDALCAALGSPEWHGTNVDAFIDSMVYGSINKVDPPYTIRIINTKELPSGILDDILYLQKCLPRVGALSNNGADIIIEIIP